MHSINVTVSNQPALAVGRNSSALKHKVVDGEYDTTLFTAHATCFNPNI